MYNSHHRRLVQIAIKGDDQIHIILDELMLCAHCNLL